MKFSHLRLVANQYRIPFRFFTIDANFTPMELAEWERNDLVPAYVPVMFDAYKEKFQSTIPSLMQQWGALKKRAEGFDASINEEQMLITFVVKKPHKEDKFGRSKNDDATETKVFEVLSGDEAKFVAFEMER